MFKVIEKIRLILLYLLSPAMFFSFFPNIIIDKTGTMNIELSLPIIWVILFSIISIPFFIRDFKFFFNKKTAPILLLPAYFIVSIFWSSNLLRAALTAGLFCLILISIAAIIHFFCYNPEKNKNLPKIKKQLLIIFIITAAIFGLYCLIQCILDIAGVHYSATYLCPVCTYQIFGFPHPNGFAAEPQYMGNLLIVPSLLSLYFFCTKSTKKILWFVLSVFFTFCLFLTLSRGAIYALGVGIILMLVLLIVKQKSPKPLLIIPLLLCSFSVTVITQGTLAALSPTNDTFYTGVAKSIDQLSLGIIDIRDLAKPSAENSESSTPIETENNDITPENNEKSTIQSDFDGYIPSSTNVRLTLTKIFLKLWLSNPNYFFFGVGIGGAGVAANKAYLDGKTYDELFLKQNELATTLLETPKQITQNEFVEIAVELGFFGVVIVILVLITLLLILKKHPHRIFFYATLIAFGVSFLFLSGPSNVIHIFLFPAMLFFILAEQPAPKKQKEKI